MTSASGKDLIVSLLILIVMGWLTGFIPFQIVGRGNVYLVWTRRVGNWTWRQVRPHMLGIIIGIILTNIWFS